MKSRGMTMVELIISIALISIIMVFVFNILVDIRQEEVNSSFKSQDLLNRSLITRTIQRDFITKGLSSIDDNCVDTTEGGLLCFNFIFRDGSTSTLKIKRNSIIYNDEKWALQTGTYDIQEEYRYCYNYTEVDKYYYMTMMFYVDLGGHVLESNVLLDLELFNTGLVENSCLPGTSNTTCGVVGELENATPICEDYRKEDDSVT